MVRKRLTLVILCAFAVVFIAACNGADLKPIPEMTPKEKATFFMAVYSDQAENYKTLAASPNLTEAQKSVLRTKKRNYGRGLSVDRPILGICRGRSGAGQRSRSQNNRVP